MPTTLSRSFRRPIKIQDEPRCSLFMFRLSTAGPRPSRCPCRSAFDPCSAAARRPSPEPPPGIASRPPSSPLQTCAPRLLETPTRVSPRLHPPERTPRSPLRSTPSPVCALLPLGWNRAADTPFRRDFGRHGESPPWVSGKTVSPRSHRLDSFSFVLVALVLA